MTYDYTDAAGNPAVQVVRAVNVDDVTVPVDSPVNNAVVAVPLVVSGSASDAGGVVWCGEGAGVDLGS